MKTLTEEQIENCRKLGVGGLLSAPDYQVICDMALGYLKCRKDAERYRWLRDKCNDFDRPNDTWILESPGFFWDAAIDAARKEKA
jgi:hypothetical protein